MGSLESEREQSDVAGVTMEDSLIGTWILVSAIMEDIETRERQHFWGQKPRGRLVITQDRWIVLQTAEDIERYR